MREYNVGVQLYCSMLLCITAGQRVQECVWESISVYVEILLLHVLKSSHTAENEYT